MSAIPIVLLCLLAAAALFAVGAAVRAGGGNGRRARQTVDELEHLAADALAVDPYDLTAQNVARTIRAARSTRRKELA